MRGYPQKLVKHCMERLTLADNFTDIDVKITDGSRGKFLVKSQRSQSNGTGFILVMKVKMSHHLVSVLTGREIDYPASISLLFLHIFPVGATTNYQHFIEIHVS